VKLSREDIVTLKVLRQTGETNQAIAARLGITEGAVRYHLRRQAEQASDGRSKLSLIEQLQLVEVVDHWWHDQLATLTNNRPPSVHALWSYLVDQYDYNGSYKSVRKFARERFPAPAKRPFRRIETPPAAQVQSDWLETKVRLRSDDGSVEIVKRYGFVMTLSHSRKTAVIWSDSMNQLAWHHVHNEAFKRLGGIAAVNRIDNLKTGVASGSGVWGTINTSYSAYARTMGFHVDPHEARQPQQKGKVERRVGAFKQLDLDRVFDSLADLQIYTDETLQRDSVVRKCPVTGKSVHETWTSERELLRPLPATMPVPFDLIKQAAVHKDCTIRFEGRTYSVPYRFAHKRVEVRGCSGFVQIVDPKDGRVLQEYPRKTRELLLIDQACYEPSADDQASEFSPRPLPLGRMARRLEEIAAQGVATRSIDFYAALAMAKSSVADSHVTDSKHATESPPG
jgi:transposase